MYKTCLLFKLRVSYASYSNSAFICVEDIIIAVMTQLNNCNINPKKNQIGI